LLLLLIKNNDEKFTANKISFILVQVKNYQIQKDSEYPMLAISLLFPNNVSIDKFAKNPFIAFYMQLDISKISFDFPDIDCITRKM